MGALTALDMAAVVALFCAGLLALLGAAELIGRALGLGGDR